ncbi:unnamed protein product, partial [marine sediment metagenome]
MEQAKESYQQNSNKQTVHKVDSVPVTDGKSDDLDHELSNYLEQAVSQQASDVHLITGVEPILRINGQLMPIEGQEPLNVKKAEQLIFSFIPDFELEKLKRDKEIDMSFDFNEEVRFRANVFYQRGKISASLRLIPSEIKSLE